MFINGSHCLKDKRRRLEKLLLRNSLFLLQHCMSPEYIDLYHDKEMKIQDGFPIQFSNDAHKYAQSLPADQCNKDIIQNGSFCK